jgi:type IV pilus assembly protein PilA
MRVMTPEFDPLSRTKPLADPGRLIARLMAGAGGALVVLAVVIAIVGAAMVGTIGAVSALAVLLPGAGLLGVGLLALPSGKPNAIYLRAFRTDRDTARLRVELAAILGPGYRLSGIRPPKKKTSLFFRFLAPGLVALRYAGSKFMELEAGDDWMARLWKTYQQTRLVFIDCRDLTTHVHLEIQMTLQTMGVERCIFIVDPRRPDEEWRQIIVAVAGPESQNVPFRLVHGDPESIRSGRTASELKADLDTLPEGVPGATDRGRQFILAHVTEEQLKKSRRPSPAALLGAVAGLALGICAGLLPRMLEAAVVIPLSVLGLLVIAATIGRAIARIARLARVGHRTAALRSSFMLAAAIFPFFVSLAILLIVALPALLRAKGQAEEAAAIASLHTIVTAEAMYEATYPANGYACSLSELGGNPQTGQPTPKSAQLIDDSLASGKKSGYTFAISHCATSGEPSVEWNAGFQVTAVPDKPQYGHPRGFCTDVTDVIRADPNGGANCTDEPIE